MALTMGQELNVQLELVAVGVKASGAWGLTVSDAAITGFEVRETETMRFVLPSVRKELAPKLRVVTGESYLPGDVSGELYYFFAFVTPVVTEFDVVEVGGVPLLEVDANDVPTLTAEAIGFDVQGADKRYYFKFAAAVTVLKVAEIAGQKRLGALVSELNG